MFNEIVRKLFKGKNDSKKTAKKRLKFALIYDKMEVSDDILKKLQEDIIEVISRYFEIDKDGLQLDITKTNELSAIKFNTPILSAKRQVTR